MKLSLEALNIGAGDQVIVPSYVCMSVLECVTSCGAEAVLCDVGPDCVVTVATVAPLIGRATRALVAPHMYGVFADIPALDAMGIPVIEDCAQAVGAAGAHPVAGTVGVLSFHPTKCLTTGEGGMVVTRDAALADRLRRLRDGGDYGAYPGRRVFAPLSDLSAALGMAQLDRYADALARRRVIAKAYDDALRDICRRVLDPARDTMHFRYVVGVPGGVDAWQAQFAAAGIQVRRGVDMLLHRTRGLPDEAFPGSVAHFERSLSLPIYPALGDAEMNHIAATARRLLEGPAPLAIPTSAGADRVTADPEQRA